MESLLEDGYVETYYTCTVVEQAAALQSLNSRVQVDVCVVGGGLAGISTALGLVERGRSVVLLEKGRLGCEASGMNGGFVIPGFAVEGPHLIEAVGAKSARVLYDWTVDALNLMKARVDKYNIKCDLQECGMVVLSCFKNQEEEAKTIATHVNSVLGTDWQVWSAETVHSMYKSNFYYHGTFDPIVHAVHPLNLTLGLARAAISQGASLYENTRAVSLSEIESPTSDIRWSVETESVDGSRGTVLARDVVLAGGSSLGPVDTNVAHSLVPLLTYIMVTEPLGEQLAAVMDTKHAIVDDRFALNYYRQLPGGRLLWGGLATSTPENPTRLKQRMLQDLAEVYPQLAKVKVDYAWGGAVSYGYHMMPMIGQRRPGLWHSTGFGGHGLIPTHMAGELLAAAIADKDERWRMFEDLFPLHYVGWPFAQALGTIAYLSYRFHDWCTLTYQRFR